MKRLIRGLCLPLAVTAGLGVSGCGKAPGDPPRVAADRPALLEPDQNAAPLADRYPRPTAPSSVTPVVLNFDAPPLPPNSQSPPVDQRPARLPDPPSPAQAPSKELDFKQPARATLSTPRIDAATPSRLPPVHESEVTSDSGPTNPAPWYPMEMPVELGRGEPSLPESFPALRDATSDGVGKPNAPEIAAANRRGLELNSAQDAPSVPTDAAQAVDLPPVEATLRRLPEATASDSRTIGTSAAPIQTVDRRSAFTPAAKRAVEVPPFIPAVKPPVERPEITPATAPTPPERSYVVGPAAVKPAPTASPVPETRVDPTEMESQITRRGPNWNPAAVPFGAPTDAHSVSHSPAINVDANEAREAVARRAAELTAQGVALARRGATFSARADLLEAVRVVAHARDQEQGNRDSSAALAAGLLAIEEADDFLDRPARGSAIADLGAVVSGHRSRIIESAAATNMTPVAALQAYYGFAQQQLAKAAGNEPEASLALYALGRLHASLAARSAEGKKKHDPRSIAFYQAALMTDSRNHLAANELGVLLARYGQWQDARRILLHSIATTPMPEAWHNLAVIHDHLGEFELAQLARNEQQLSRAKATSAGQPTDESIVWVDGETFDRVAPADALPGQPAASPSVREARAPRPRATAPWWMPWK